MQLLLLLGLFAAMSDLSHSSITHKPNIVDFDANLLHEDLKDRIEEHIGESPSRSSEFAPFRPSRAYLTA
jgi:hypothetical protein